MGHLKDLSLPANEVILLLTERAFEGTTKVFTETIKSR